MSKVYIAARFSRRHECHKIGKMLQAQGHEIVSRWTLPDSDHVVPVGMSQQAADDERRRFAVEDVEDVLACDWMVSLMEEPRNNSRGGRHIEFGIALGLHKRLTIIGPRETVFHHLPHVEHYDTTEEFCAALRAMVAAGEAEYMPPVSDEQYVRGYNKLKMLAGTDGWPSLTDFVAAVDAALREGGE